MLVLPAAAIAAVFLIFLLRPGPPVWVKSSIDKRSITPGETIRYNLTVSAVDGARVAPPDLDGIFTGLAIRYRDEVRRLLPGRVVTEHRRSLTAYRPGTFRISDLPIRYSYPAAAPEREIVLNGTDIAVKTTMKDVETATPSFTFSDDMVGKGGSASGTARDRRRKKAEDITVFPIKEIDRPRGLLTYTDMALIVCLAVMASAAVVLALFVAAKVLLRKRVVIPDPPHKIALDRLQALRKAHLRGGLGPGDFCMRLSPVIKEYVQARFGLGTGHMTTTEFLAAVRNVDALTPEQKAYLERLIKVCDFVKYAKYVPPAGELDMGLEAEKRFVQDTKTREDSGGPPK
jgi:hypothetical protein